MDCDGRGAGTGADCLPGAGRLHTRGVERGEADLWDSGKVLSAANLVEYGGMSLASEQGVWWRVRAWDGEDQSGAYSTPAYFEMGLLAPDDWDADWIGFPGAWPGKAMYFRRDFTLAKPVRRARIYMAGLGYAELRVNGRKANDRVLDPPQTDYSKRVLYSTDAVETLLRAGNNTIGVICGSGWFGSARLLLQMHVDYADGSSERIVTETYWPQPWLVFTGPLLENSIYDGETYDARLENSHWDDPDAQPPAGLVAGCADSPGGKLVAAALEPIQVVETRRAQKILQPHPDTYVFDMGQNLAGWARLRVRGPAGCRVLLRFAETIHPDGTVNQENLRTAKATDTYILKGEGEEMWEPRFTYHGFRYVQVEGYPGVPTADDVVACVVRSAVASAGSFTCSSELFNRIDRMVRWTEASNLHGVPTDCPQRDERMGWLNDLAARSEEAIYNFDMARLFAKWMDDIADAQDPRTGAITDTAPFRWGRRPADPVSVCYLQIPWLLYVHYGDTYTLRKHYGGMQAWVEFLRGCAQDGIIPYSYYGDWAPPVHLGISGSQGSSAVSRDTPGELVSTACYAFSLDLLSRIARVLQREEECARLCRPGRADQGGLSPALLERGGGRLRQQQPVVQRHLALHGHGPARMHAARPRQPRARRGGSERLPPDDGQYLHQVPARSADGSGLWQRSVQHRQPGDVSKLGLHAGAMVRRHCGNAGSWRRAAG